MGRVALLIAAAIASGSCTAALGYTFTRTGAKPPAAEPPGCTFGVSVSRPPGVLAELGVLSVGKGQRAARTLVEFQQAVGPEVCAAGGQVVVAEVDPRGHYRRGTVLRYQVVRSGLPPAAPVEE